MQVSFVQKATPGHCYIKYTKPLDYPQVLPLDVDNRSPDKLVQTTCLPFVVVPLIYTTAHSYLYTVRWYLCIHYKKT
jgi:hypothetical protein